MKNLFLLFLSVCLIQLTSWSQQSPQGIPYQAAARSLDGSLIAGRTIGIQFTLYYFENESDFRTDHYSEYHQVTTDDLGLFSVTIGKGTPRVGEFGEIPWSSQSMWIEVALDRENSGEYTPVSNSPLLSVPYALHSLSASRIAGEEERGPGGSNSNNWHTFGNANTDPSEDFLGTSDAADLSIITDSQERIRILATGEISIDSDLSIGNNLEVGNDATIGNDLDVTNNAGIGNDLDVTNNAGIGNDIDVTNNAGIGNDLEVSNNTSIGNDLDVQGLTQLHDDLNLTKSDTGFIATFQNDDTDIGDGILIQLGKVATKNNNAAQLADLTAKQYLGVTKVQDYENIRKLLEGDFNEIETEWIANISFPTDPDEAETFLLELASGACLIVEDVVLPLIDDGLNFVLEETLDLIETPINAGLSAAETFVQGLCVGFCDPDFEVSLDPGDPFNFESWFDGACSAAGLSDTLPFPSLDLGNWEPGTDPLTKENVFIEFADSSGWRMGAVKAQSVEEWALGYLDEVYLFNLYATFRRLDRSAVPTEIKKLSKKTAKDFVAVGVSYSSGNGDYAEWLERTNHDEHIEAGDVVGVKSGKISRNINGCEQVMAISAKPIVLGNTPEEGMEHTGNNVAFMGQIPVKVMGPVSSGDYIVASGTVPGYAKAVNPELMTLEDFNHAVGRSWEDSDIDGPHMVNTIIGMHNGDYLNVLQRFESRMKSAECRLQDIEATLEGLSRSHTRASNQE